MGNIPTGICYCHCWKESGGQYSHRYMLLSLLEGEWWAIFPQVYVIVIAGRRVVGNIPTGICYCHCWKESGGQYSHRYILLSLLEGEWRAIFPQVYAIVIAGRRVVGNIPTGICYCHCWKESGGQYSHRYMLLSLLEGEWRAIFPQVYAIVIAGRRVVGNIPTGICYCHCWKENGGQYSHRYMLLSLLEGEWRAIFPQVYAIVIAGRRVVGNIPTGICYCHCWKESGGQYSHRYMLLSLLEGGWWAVFPQVYILLSLLEGEWWAIFPQVYVIVVAESLLRWQCHTV